MALHEPWLGCWRRLGQAATSRAVPSPWVGVVDAVFEKAADRKQSA